MVVLPHQSHVVRFINLTVAPAMKSVCEELQGLGFDAEVQQKLSADGDSEGWTLNVAHHGEYQNFSYSVRPVAEDRPPLTTADTKRPDNEIYYRAEVHLSEGGQDYDIMGWTE
ncbi:choline BCCT transporter BetT [Oligella ureolytica]